MLTLKIKEFKMIKNLLFSVILIVTLTSADGDRSFSEITEENKLLKLKVEVYQLKEEIIVLKKIIGKFDKGDNNETKRANAIVKLRRELRMGRSVDYQ
jgi:hypothetical protein